MDTKTVTTKDPKKLVVGYLECSKCGRTWIPRHPRPPKVCPDRECRSMRWDEPKD